MNGKKGRRRRSGRWRGREKEEMGGRAGGRKVRSRESDDRRDAYKRKDK